MLADEQQRTVDCKHVAVEVLEYTLVLLERAMQLVDGTPLKVGALSAETAQ